MKTQIIKKLKAVIYFILIGGFFMFESVGRSWEITKLSFNVVKSDKKMLLFPLLAGIFSLLFIIVMIFPTIITGFLISGLDESIADIAILAILFLIYLGLAAIATFFNVCVVYTAKKRFEGGESKFMETIGFAFSKLPTIIAWALVSATVGVILKLLSDQAGKMGAGGLADARGACYSLHRRHRTAKPRAGQ